MLNCHYLDDAVLRSLRDDFNREGYVKLPGVLEPSLSHLSECMDRMCRNATRRSFVMPGVLTPRQMSTIGGRRLESEEPGLAALYRHPQIRALVSGLVGGEIYGCQHEEEFMVANFLTNAGDSHGWHVDDPAYALILIVDAPAAELGGCLEFISDWDPSEIDVLGGVAKAREEGRVQVRHHAAGDGYLLKASTTLHRVTSIAQPVRRMVLNLAYQSVPTQSYGYTATALYGEMA